MNLKTDVFLLVAGGCGADLRWGEEGKNVRGKPGLRVLYVLAMSLSEGAG